MDGIVLIVDFQLKPGSLSRFIELVTGNARASVRDEPGCRRFDVLQSSGEPDRAILYEHYVDEGAFEAHPRTSHFLAFEHASAELVAEESVRRLAVISINPDERRDDLA